MSNSCSQISQYVAQISQILAFWGKLEFWNWKHVTLSIISCYAIRWILVSVSWIYIGYWSGVWRYKDDQITTLPRRHNLVGKRTSENQRQLDVIYTFGDVATRIQHESNVVLTSGVYWASSMKSFKENADRRSFLWLGNQGNFLRSAFTLKSVSAIYTLCLDTILCLK